MLLREWDEQKGFRVSLELTQLTEQVQAMGKTMAGRRRQWADQVALAHSWLRQYAHQGAMLRPVPAGFHAAIPTDEPLDATYPLPSAPARYTVIAADGAQIQPDRHGAALYYLINIGSVVYRHGSGQAPQAAGQPTLGYADADLYEDGLLVSGNLLDVRRDLAEITRLADLCAEEPPGATVALVDGTLLLWVLEERPPAWRAAKIQAYLAQMERIRAGGAALAAFASRPRRAEVTRLLHLAHLGGDVEQAGRTPNPLEHLPDRMVFEGLLPPGARSALFVSPARINREGYEEAGHGIHFCYLNLSPAGRRPVVARIEVPAWVVGDPAALALVHAVIVEQARIVGDYPYALARADEMAFISTPERNALEEMIIASLWRAGARPAYSPKKHYKTLTRQGKRRYRG